MLDSQQLEALHHSLKALLAQLQAGQIQCVAYGVGEEDEHSLMSYLKIRYIQTAGGRQFGLKTISGGVEGTGYYTPDMDEMLSHACGQVIHFHRPTPLTEHLKKMRQIDGKSRLAAKQYFWYPTTSAPSLYHEAALDRGFLDRLGEIKTIDLR